MEINPVLKRLGFSERDRLVIIHTDDIGMCHASVQAYADLFEAGIVSSGATMVPCSWFPWLAAKARENVNFDLGVHLTLTCEWDTYRWGPLSTHDASSGLVDNEGYFYRTSEDVQKYCAPDAAQHELEMQYLRATSAGIDVTHLDTHMNTVAHPKFILAYIQLALRNKLPLLFPRKDSSGFQQLGLDAETSTIAAGMVHQLEEQGLPLLDHVAGMNLENPNDRLEQVKHELRDLPVGITHFIIHPSIESLEIKTIAPDWQCRVADYRTFLSDDLRKFIDNIGLHIIGYRALKSLIQ